MALNFEAYYQRDVSAMAEIAPGLGEVRGAGGV